MGRGRQKAKHMKVARRLKYYSPETDLDALQRELTMSSDPQQGTADAANSDEQDADDWSGDSWGAHAASYSSGWDDYED